MANGKIVTLLSSEEVCSQLTYDDKDKNNIRILNHYFLFTKDGFEDLKKYPVTLMKVKYLTESKDYVFQKELNSNIMNKKFTPETYFIDNLKCVE
ncbi:hypothetical protein [Flavobacterium sp.]|uniref:hypothetical protein n=1 Tax=Flavobacterium sp. TaxID=239 RepID=UPI0028BD8E63|nr:hypothetical protein [Flavobacterium sp.]